MAQMTKADNPNVVARVSRYVGDVRSEMRRVVWPTRQEVVNASIVVVITLIMLIAFVSLVDQASSFVFFELRKAFGR